MVIGSEFPVTGGVCVPRPTDDLDKASRYPRPSGFLVMLQLCRFRHHLLVLVVSNQFPFCSLTSQCFINNGFDNKFIPGATCTLLYKALAIPHWL